jgi:hypothetical protein
MDGRERALRDFETITAQIADLERQLAEAKTRQDQLRRALRAALRTGALGAEKDGASEPSAAVVEAVEAVRKLGEAADATKVAETLGVTPSVARTRLQRAAGIGVLRRVKRGRYEVVEASE